jgi:hypothetical protein
VRFTEDLFGEGGVTLVSVQPGAMRQVVEAMDEFGLDFDDAYQYIAADQAGALIVSRDEHFGRTVHGRQTPHRSCRRARALPNEAGHRGAHARLSLQRQRGRPHDQRRREAPARTGDDDGRS